MLSRALSLATVMLLVSFAAVPVQAQNLEAGKTPSQIFSGTCTACHKSARGLLKTVTPGALPGFLRQHYTTSTGMAASLSAYLVSNGASDRRYDDGLTRQGQEAAGSRKPADARSGAAPAPAAAAPAELPSFFGFGRRAEPEARPEPEAAPMTPRQKRAADRAAKRLARPAADAPDASRPAEAPALEAPRAQKQRPGTKGRRNREGDVRPDSAKDEPVKPEMARPEPARQDTRPEVPKPETARPEPARIEPAVRADPVPAVTPAAAEPKAEEKPEPKPEPSEAKPASE